MLQPLHDNLESFEAINQDDVTRDLVLRMAALSQAGKLGPFLFERVPATVLPTGFFNRGFPGDSIVGYDVLEKFLVRLDYPRRRVWLRRRADAQPFYDPRRPEAQSQMAWTIPAEPEDALVAQPPRDTIPLGSACDARASVGNLKSVM